MKKSEYCGAKVVIHFSKPTCSCCGRIINSGEIV